MDEVTNDTRHKVITYELRLIDAPFCYRLLIDNIDLRAELDSDKNVCILISIGHRAKGQQPLYGCPRVVRYCLIAAHIVSHPLGRGYSISNS